jgi:hypothetical protein
VQETPGILASGGRDVRAPFLLAVMDDLFVAMHDLMQRQTKVSPPALTATELSKLCDQLKKAITALAESGIPDTLNHLDMNPGNIFISDQDCIFLDWAEGAVGHPFLTFEYLWEHFKRLHPENSTQREDLISSYANGWRVFASPELISSCLSLTPLLAVFTHAVSTQIWRNHEKLVEPVTAAYFRSLVRRMKREADSIEARRGNV